MCKIYIPLSLSQLIKLTNSKPMTLVKEHFKPSYAILLQRTQFEAVASANFNIAGKMKKMATIGFDGVELAIRKPSDIDISELKSGIELSGLKVPVLGTGQAYHEEGLSI